MERAASLFAGTWILGAVFIALGWLTAARVAYTLQLIFMVQMAMAHARRAGGASETQTDSPAETFTHWS